MEDRTLMLRLTFPTLIILQGITQLRSQKWDLPLQQNIFDDQYISCSENLETEIMPNLLKEEKSQNPQFREAWDKAEEKWRNLTLSFYYDYNFPLCPVMFKDEYSIALILYTMQDPDVQKVRQQFNANVSVAGVSRDEYMKNFHYKSLHFYLTRGLQTYPVKQKEKIRVLTKDNVPENTSFVFRYGHFLRSTREKMKVSTHILTSYFGYKTDCFGIYYNEPSEIIIPISETFFYVGTIEGIQYVISSGLQCSYFNCAYLGAEKRKSPLCGSDYDQKIFNGSGPRRGFLLCGGAIPYIFCGFILVIAEAFSKLVCSF
ncbi:ecto-ADP-ribosyltransferase 3-like [Spea bombifrons]|uniref:ecto-ADP-ribosyltransferase 3-like n=1 Tax=Spea bombifrons TaxID=233779 RepID=UPI00234BD3CC|nr:ecto-ADP-ribosyltransferase 3-like [Spea bombifrons]XP_053312565.1 ecto-ADP-ribosyltransferase 3-like [Spea bombifrons]